MTHTATHTPGPFEVVYHSYGYEIKRAHVTSSCTTMETIATIKPQGDKQCANAHLIAAAPAMYEALRSIPDHALNCEHSYPHTLACWNCTIKTALAQAEGRQA